MSRTYAIACTQCKKSLWIGQAGGGSDQVYLYLGDGKTDAALEKFLSGHEGHPLVFKDEIFLDGYSEADNGEK